MVSNRIGSVSNLMLAVASLQLGSFLSGALAQQAPPSQASPPAKSVDNPLTLILETMKRGDFAGAERQIRARLDPSKPGYEESEQLLVICLAEQKQESAVVAELDRAIALRPDSLDLKVFAFEVARDLLDVDDQLPSIARKVGSAIAQRAKTNPESARRAAYRIVQAAIEPELLQPLMTATMRTAAARPAASRSELFEDYYDYLRESAQATSRGCQAVQQRLWESARSSFYKGADWAKDAQPGYPRQAAVVKPMLRAAAAAAALLDDQVGLAKVYANEGLGEAALAPQRARLGTVLALAESLQQSPLDREWLRRQGGQGADAANTLQLQADLSTQSLPTQMYINSWCNSMLTAH